MFTFEQALSVANTLFAAQVGRYLSDAETAIFRGAWEGQTYETIAEVSCYSVSYLKRDVGPKFWKLLSQALGESVSKKNFRSALERQGAFSPNNVSITPISTFSSWGEAPDVSRFYGRTEELNTLKQWILEDNSRLIALLGMGGVGKTSLSVKLAQNIGGFETVIWRSLRNAPPLDSLLNDLILFLSNQEDTEINLERLLYWLRNRRSLIILDNFETVLLPGAKVGQYRAGYENYGELLRVIGETHHHSCLIITSREKPFELATQEGMDFPVHSLLLKGSLKASLGIIQAKGLIGTEADQQLLCEQYDCNPLALKIVATSIQDLFDGSIQEFLAQNTIVFNGIRRLLEQQFKRLSPLETTIMYWLAINREWTRVTELVEDIFPSVSHHEILETLESLCWRSLLEKRLGSYTHQPVVMEYVTDYFTEQITEEILTQNLSLFSRFPLIKTTVKDYIRQTQTQLIIAPIAQKIKKYFTSIAHLEAHFKLILAQIKQQKAMAGYDGGNWINLCLYLQIDLTDYDLSYLTIWQADLQGINLHQVNLAYSDLKQSLFTQTLGIVFTVALSPNGQFLATGDFQGEIYIWHIPSGQQWLTFQGHSKPVRSILFSPDGQLLVSGSEDKTIKIWELKTGTLLKTIPAHEREIFTLALSSDGQILASGSSDNTIKLWTISTGELLNSLSGHNNWIWSVTFSPDGQTLVSGGEDNSLKIWDCQTGNCKQTLLGHGDMIWTVAFSPDGRTIASGSRDNTIKLWNVEKGECYQTLLGHKAQVWTITFSPDGQYLASGGADKIIRLWNLKTSQWEKTLQGHTHAIRSLCFGSNSQVLVSGSHDQTARLWDINHGKCLKVFQGHTQQILSVTFRGDGQTLVSGSADHKIRLWDIKTGQAVKTFAGHQGWVQSVCCSPDGNLLASGSHERTVRLWDINRSKCLLIGSDYKDWVRSIAFSPDGQLLASSSDENLIRLWRVSNGEIYQILAQHTNWVFSLCFSSDGQWLASGGADQMIKIWDMKTGDVFKTLLGHQGSIFSVRFSPDHQKLASAGQDKTIYIWDVKRGKLLLSLQGHQDNIHSIAWRCDGDILASSGGDRSIKLWDSHTGECLATWEGHKGAIFSLDWSPEGEILASGSADETIRLWDAKTGRSLQILRSDRPYEKMNITGIRGLTEAQKLSLKILGAVENE